MRGDPVHVFVMRRYRDLCRAVFGQLRWLDRLMVSLNNISRVICILVEGGCARSPGRYNLIHIRSGPAIGQVAFCNYAGDIKTQKLAGFDLLLQGVYFMVFKTGSEVLRQIAVIPFPDRYAAPPAAGGRRP